MEIISGIYQIKNLINNKLYIGSAVNIKQRWYGHLSELKRNKHSNKHLQASWNKYGAENFVFEIVCIVEDINNLPKKETEYISLFKCADPDFGYNLYPVSGSPRGYKHSKETKEKLSKIQKGKFRSREASEKTANANRGKKQSKEAIQNMKNAQILWGSIRIISDETKKKLSESSMGRVFSDETRKKISDAKIGKKIKRVLNEEKVSEIKQMLRDGMKNTEIAKIFGVTVGAITSIKRGRSWKNVN